MSQRRLKMTYSEQKLLKAEINNKRHARSVFGDTIRRSTESRDISEKENAHQQATRLKWEVGNLERQLAQTENRLLSLASVIPNDTHPDTPTGPESAAVILSTNGPSIIATDPARDHVSICNELGLLDLESASTVTGSSWYYLMREAALLELALTNYAMSIAYSHGFMPVITPDIVRADIASRCGFQPRDSCDSPVSQMYHVRTSDTSPDLVLAGTSEIPLAGMFANKILPESSLPVKLVGMNHSFREEAGSRGTDTRGLYRVHQFTKIELFSVTTMENSEVMMKEMLSVQKAIMEGLNLPFRVLNMPSQELGASAYQKIDIEAWMPGRGAWGEVSSLSNCTDYQSRRLHIRYRRPFSLKECQNTSSLSTFAHTLNGTAVAIPRLIIALLENGAIFDHRRKVIGISLPNVLKPFWISSAEKQSLIKWSS